MFRFLIVALSLVVLVLSGLAHGMMTCRWTPTEPSPRWAERWEQIPTTIGEYECRDREMDVKPEDRAAAQLLRRYVHRRTGASVSVWLAAGPPGPLCIHTPDWCYRASGYEMTSGKTRQSVPLGAEGEKGEFWMADFRKVKPTGTENVRVFWGWNAGGGWQAPESPRMAYTRATRLHKLYFVCSLDSGKAPAEEGWQQFIQSFLPEADRFMH